ncbi:VOC family protein [Microbacterium sp.]|uniref:VOC family protein n=1 Tax=Microbacterium sp. TaxID=51671 RepID=UPI0028119BD6|nr:VOC family protein [Microbacterium sp.]
MDAVALGPIGQISRSVTDIEAAEAWYRDVLGLRHLYTFGSLSFFDCDGVRLFLSAGDGPVHDESILYFRVPDVVAARAALGERGVVFTHEPHVIHTHEDGTQEWMAFFTDVEGRPLALMAQRRPD